MLWLRFTKLEKFRKRGLTPAFFEQSHSDNAQSVHTEKMIQEKYGRPSVSHAAALSVVSVRRAVADAPDRRHPDANLAPAAAYIGR